MMKDKSLLKSGAPADCILKNTNIIDGKWDLLSMKLVELFSPFQKKVSSCHTIF